RLNRSCAGVSHARPCRPLSWLCLALDRHVGWPHLRAQRREGAAAAAPSWLSPDQRDVAPRGPRAVGAFQPDHSRFSRLWLGPPGPLPFPPPPPHPTPPRRPPHLSAGGPP